MNKKNLQIPDFYPALPSLLIERLTYLNVFFCLNSAQLNTKDQALKTLFAFD